MAALPEAESRRSGVPGLEGVWRSVGNLLLDGPRGPDEPGVLTALMSGGVANLPAPDKLPEAGYVCSGASSGPREAEEMFGTGWKKRTRNIYSPEGKTPYRLSRSKIELFLECQRCFYLDRREGMTRPSGPPFSLNNAVDLLMKREFDAFRAKQQPHPLVQAHGLKLVPLAHPELDRWRNALSQGVTYHDTQRQLIITGGIDDVWVSPDGTWTIVDYKATARKQQPIAYKEYRRQLSFYAWLLRHQGGQVADVGYLVYANGQLDRPNFDARLSFDMHLLPCRLDVSWVEETIDAAWRCLRQPSVPKAHPDCCMCAYAQATAQRCATRQDGPTLS